METNSVLSCSMVCAKMAHEEHVDMKAMLSCLPLALHKRGSLPSMPALFYVPQFTYTHLCPTKRSPSKCGDFSVTPQKDFLAVPSVLTSIQFCLRDKANPGLPTSTPS